MPFRSRTRIELTPFWLMRAAASAIGVSGLHSSNWPVCMMRARGNDGPMVAPVCVFVLFRKAGRVLGLCWRIVPCRETHDFDRHQSPVQLML